MARRRGRAPYDLSLQVASIIQSMTSGVNAIFKGIERTTLAEWQAIVDVNLTGVFLCCKHLGGAIGEGGSIINISSVAGHGGLPRSVPYCASKGGVEMLTKALALDWARRKIREEALVAAYGVDTQKRMTAEQDAQLQRAVAELPSSGQLAERARRMVRTSKK